MSTRIIIRVAGALLLIMALLISWLPVAQPVFAAPKVNNLYQWANGTPTVDPEWQFGNLNASNSAYYECDSVPYYTSLSGLTVDDIYYITIEWDTTKGGKHAIDYITTYDRSYTPYDPCLDAGLPTDLSPDTEPIPPDSNVPGGIQEAGDFTIFYGTFVDPGGDPDGDATTAYTLTGSYTGDSSTSITLYFRADETDLVIAWGGHIASQADWGAGNSAVGISGSPYHMRILDFYNVSQDDQLSVGNMDRSMSSATIVDVPVIEIVKTVSPSVVSSSGPVTYTYEVTNEGNVSLTGVTVVDDNGTPVDTGDDFEAVYVSGDTDSDDELDIDETWIYTATRIITQDDIDAGTPITNWATADSSESDPDMDDATVNITQNPAIAIVKTVSPPVVSSSGPVTYTYEVTNEGNVSLTVVTVVDDNGTPVDTSDDFEPVYVSGDTDSDDELDIDETWTYTATRTITDDEITAGTPITNWATADSSESDPDMDDATVTITEEDVPVIAIVKTASPSVVCSLPQSVTYTYEVTNEGNVSLTVVTVVDDNGTPVDTGDDFDPAYVSGDTDGDGELDVDETWTYTATRVITQDDIDAGIPITNWAEADSSESDPASDDATVNITQCPAIAIIKTASPIIVSSLPQSVTYTYGVTNEGNVSLTGVTVTDDNGTPGDTGDDFNPILVSGDTDGDGELDVDETWTYTATRVITQDDIDAGTPITNWATADSNESDPARHDATVTITRAPAITIVKTVSPIVVSPPQSVTYTYQVTNQGNISLTVVTVVDDNGTPGDTGDDFTPAYVSGDDGDNKLEIGETWIYTATRVITQPDAVNFVNNWAEANSSESDPDIDDATVTITQEDVPVIAIVKTVSPSEVSSPGPVTYTYKVTNKGNVPLTVVTVVDDNGTIGDTSDDFYPTYVSGDDGDNILEVGETWIYEATRTITQDEINAGSPITNWAEADSNESDPASDDATVTIIQIVIEYDYGDAPDPTYPTLITNNGAGHVIVPGFFLGARIDAEADGQPSVKAIGDDNNGTDDEDGVRFPVLVKGEQAFIGVNVSGSGGVVEAWIDFNSDGIWQHTGEQVFAGFLNVGTHSIAIPIPMGAVTGKTYARVRLSSQGGLTPDGLASDGEVEDYMVSIVDVYEVPTMTFWGQLVTAILFAALIFLAVKRRLYIQAT